MGQIKGQVRRAAAIVKLSRKARKAQDEAQRQLTNLVELLEDGRPFQEGSGRHWAALKLELLYAYRDSGVLSQRQINILLDIAKQALARCR